MDNLASLTAVVRGRVQGVFFRAFVEDIAEELVLTGYVRNLPGGDAIQVVAEGKRDRLEKLLQQLKIGPPAARVEKVETTWAAYTGNYSEFRVKR